MDMIECVTDEDYEKFAFFFLHNRKIFDDMYPLLESIGSLYVMIDETTILLFSRQQDGVIAAASYTFGTRECNFEDKDVVFIDCVLIKKEYQNSRLFVRSFRQMLQHIAKEHKEVKEVRFNAYRHHYYIHELYKKFATIIGEREDFFGIQDVFSVEFDCLVQYLDQLGKKKVELYE